jgi:hypothetical protein
MRTTTARIAPLAAVGVLAWLLAAAAPADAGFYDVVACRAANAPPGQPAPSGAFADFGHLGIPTEGMTMYRGCVEAGGRVSGLVAENTRTGRRVRRGRQAGFYLAAPEQTTISHLWWSGKIWRRDCRYSVGAYAVGTGGPLRTIENRQAGRNCPRRERRGGKTKIFLASATVGRPDVPKPFPMPPGVTGIVQRVACVGGPNGFCTDRSLNRIVTWYARATINDPHAPAASIVQDNPFTQGAWTGNSTQSVGYTANDPYGGGIKTVAAHIAGAQSQADPAACDNTQTVPCGRQRTGRVVVKTTEIPEGTQQLVVRALDAADNAGDSAPVTVRVDRTAPGAAAVSVEGGDGWRSQNSFTAVWQNPDEGDRAPITAAHWRLCRSGTNSCTTGSQAGTGISRLADLRVPEPGEYQLTVVREDAAGNQNDAYASQPVTLRHDPEAPQLAFEPAPPEDPTRVSVAVTERISGIAGGQLEISAAGSNSWQALPAKLEGNRLVAHIDDSALAPGQYLVRGQATDLAGNVGVATTPQPLTLPLRIQSALQAGVVTTRIVRDRVEAKGKKGKKGRRGARRRTVTRRVIELRPESRVRFGSHATIAGRLTNRDGQGLPGQEIRVLGPGAGGEELLALLTTDAQGAFSYRAAGAASRTLRFVHAGTATVLPAESRVTLVVPAAGSFKVSRKRLPNGRSVVFRGRVASLPLPAAGKLVELQVYYGRKQGWKTFRTMRTDAQGRWAMRYRFLNTECHTTYRLRARIPTEAGYPFAPGRSRTRKVRVLGAEGPCP